MRKHALFEYQPGKSLESKLLKELAVIIKQGYM